MLRRGGDGEMRRWGRGAGGRWMTEMEDVVLRWGEGEGEEGGGGGGRRRGKRRRGKMQNR